ncbi:MAG TPA: DUF4097 family beta strand repeat-containing protein [Chloroflexota bacterium]|nr:DUF4097 family beta strand repeat-containing protein [Chloroflexota bacterium]
MSTVQHRAPAGGLRTIHAHLDHGSVRFVRIDGDDVVVEASEGISVERSGDELRIRAGGRRSESGRSRHKMTFDYERGTAEPGGPGVHGEGDLGSLIGTVVTQAMGGLLRGDFFSGGSHGRVRIGVPALLEMPRIEARSAIGDLSLEGLRGEIVLHSHMGDVSVDAAGGTLEARSGKGDIEIKGFAGSVLAHTGAGDLELEGCTAGGSGNTGAGDIEGRRLGGEWQLRTGSGDVRIEGEESASFQIDTGSGDVGIYGGAVDRLEIRTGSGDLECRSVLRGPRHRFTTGAGDISLALANPPGARVQALTRMGTVRSEFPLVMVGKQGPHSGSGARHVGNIGDSAIDVELKTGYGDIEIVRLEPGRPSRPYRPDQASDPMGAGRGFPVPPIPSVPPMPPMPAAPPIPPMAPGSNIGWPVVPEFDDFPVEERVMSLEEPQSLLNEETLAPLEGRELVGAAAPAGAPEIDSPRLRVLESLQRGEITVQEAAALLRSLSGN